MRCIWHQFLHHAAYLGQLVHQPHLVVQSACCVNNHNIALLGYGRLECVVGHAGGVGTHALLHNGDTYTVSPQLQLLDSGGTEGVGGTEYHLTSGLLVAVGQLGDSGGLADTVDTHHEYHVWTLWQRGIKRLRKLEVTVRIVIDGVSQYLRYLCTEYGVQLRGGDILVTTDAFL